MRLALILALALPLGLAASDDVVVHRGSIVFVPAEDHDHEEPILFEAESGQTFKLDLEADNHHALHDPLLKERLWEFEGRVRDDGWLNVRKMFTIKDGKRFRVTYYCEICHIVSYRPGRCMCCQEDVVLQEIPGEE